MPDFLVDTQLPPALAKFFQSKGYNAKHTCQYEEGYLLQDAQIITIALKENRTIITKDSDFWDHYFIKGYPPNVLYVDLGNMKNTELIQIFETNLKDILALFQQGNHLVVLQKDNIIGF